ncbi:MAG: NADH-quinone oxidoreductase subunit NuoB [Chloroflexota bacterium]|nr:NADH-quinone oxidoreductase subunit NuoB [Chloroflexota bacterium]
MAEVPDELDKNILLTTVDFVYNLSRSYSLWPMTFGLACCAIEFIVAGTARYDMSRFGMEVARPSPRQADLLIISGTVTKKMVVPIVRLYNQMAEPRYVLAMGACATGGGPFKEGYNVVSGIDKYLPVSVYVPGCPPTPEALIHGFISLHNRFKTESVRTVPWYQKEYTGETPIPVLGPDIINTQPQAVRRVRDVNMRRLMEARASVQPTISGIAASGDGEQVLITNQGLAQDLTGWKLVSDQKERTYEFPTGFVLMSDSEVNVYSGPEAKTMTPNDLVWTKKNVWTGDSGSASLLDAEGNTVSTFSF